MRLQIFLIVLFTLKYVVCMSQYQRCNNCKGDALLIPKRTKNHYIKRIKGNLCVIIDDTIKEAERLKDKINKRMSALAKDIARRRAKIDSGELSDKQEDKQISRMKELQSHISNMETSKSNIDALGNDPDNTYAFKQTEGGEHYITKGEDNVVYIETSSPAISIHEITHVKQSLDAGGLAFNPKGRLKNSGATEIDKSNNEVEAYKLQYSYDLSFPGTTTGLSGINVHSVGNITNQQGLRVYLYIHNYAITLINPHKQ